VEVEYPTPTAFPAEDLPAEPAGVVPEQELQEAPVDMSVVSYAVESLAENVDEAACMIEDVQAAAVEAVLAPVTMEEEQAAKVPDAEHVLVLVEQDGVNVEMPDLMASPIVEGAETSEIAQALTMCDAEGTEVLSEVAPSMEAEGAVDSEAVVEMALGDEHVEETGASHDTSPDAGLPQNAGVMAESLGPNIMEKLRETDKVEDGMVPAVAAGDAASSMVASEGITDSVHDDDSINAPSVFVPSPVAATTRSSSPVFEAVDMVMAAAVLGAGSAMAMTVDGGAASPSRSSSPDEGTRASSDTDTMVEQGEKVAVDVFSVPTASQSHGFLMGLEPSSANPSLAEEVWLSIFTPGLNVRMQGLMHATFAALFLSLVTLFVLTDFNLHVLFLLVVAICLYTTTVW
jgi:hypothetical protein